MVLLLATSVKGHGRLFIGLLGYSGHGNRDVSGACCDPDGPEDDMCWDACDMVVQLSAYGIDGRNVTNQRFSSLPISGEGMVEFPIPVITVDTVNPTLFSFRKWQNELTITAQIYDLDGQYTRSGGPHAVQMVDEFSLTLSLPRPSDMYTCVTVPSALREGTQLRLAARYVCDPSYGGPDCATDCLLRPGSGECVTSRARRGEVEEVEGVDEPQNSFFGNPMAKCPIPGGYPTPVPTSGGNNPDGSQTTLPSAGDVSSTSGDLLPTSSSTMTDSIDGHETSTSTQTVIQTSEVTLPYTSTDIGALSTSTSVITDRPTVDPTNLAPSSTQGVSSTPSEPSLPTTVTYSIPHTTSQTGTVEPSANPSTSTPVNPSATDSTSYPASVHPTSTDYPSSYTSEVATSPTLTLPDATSKLPSPSVRPTLDPYLTQTPTPTIIVNPDGTTEQTDTLPNSSFTGTSTHHYEVTSPTTDPKQDTSTPPSTGSTSKTSTHNSGMTTPGTGSRTTQIGGQNTNNTPSGASGRPSGNSSATTSGAIPASTPGGGAAGGKTTPEGGAVGGKTTSGHQPSSMLPFTADKEEEDDTMKYWGPIVGSVLGGLAVFGVIGYFIYRNRQRAILAHNDTYTVSPPSPKIGTIEENGTSGRSDVPMTTNLI